MKRKYCGSIAGFNTEKIKAVIENGAWHKKSHKWFRLG